MRKQHMQDVQYGKLIYYLLFFTMVLSGCGGGGGGDTGGGGNTPPSSGTGANGVAIFWLNYGTGMGAGNSVQETSDGGFILAGYQQSSSTAQADGIVVKTDSKGAVQWQKTFGGSDWDMGNSVQQTADGGYIVAGCLNCGFGAPGPGSFYLLKLDGSGNKVWDKSISGSLLSGAYAVRQSKTGGNPDGYVFVGMNANQNVALIKTDLTGNVTWQQFLTSLGVGVGFTVEQTRDGGYVIAGDYAAPSGMEMWLIKIDANRAIVWDKRFGTGEAFSVKQTTDDGYILVGRTTVRTGVAAPTPGDAVVIKTDKDGNEVWRRTFGGVEDDEARSVALTLDGGYIVAGKTLSFGPGPVDYTYSWQWEDVFLIKLDANGNMLWGKVKGHRPHSSDGGASVFPVSDGGYIVTGNSNAYQSGTILLMKADKNGDTVNLGTEDLTVTVPSTIGTINFTNAIDVAAAGVKGFTLPHDVGTTSLSILIDKANGTPPGAFCNAGGSYSATLNPVGPVATGSVLTVSFNSCVNGQRTLTGSFTLTVESMTGSFSSDYTVQTTIDPINITSTESAGTLTNTTTGGTRFRRQSASGNYTEQSQSITTPTPATLTYSETQGGITRTRVVGPFTIDDSVTSGAFSFGGAGDTATVTTGSASGALTVTLPQPVVGASLGSAPSSGSFRITAQDNSSLTGTVTSGGVTLAIDTNADGTIDGTIVTGWDFLY